MDLKYNQDLFASESQSTQTAVSSRFVCSNTASTTSYKPSLRRRNTTGPGMIFSAMDPYTDTSSFTFSKVSPLQSPHLDKRFFDSSLIEIRSLASSSSTIDDCVDEIWIRRVKTNEEEKLQVRHIFYHYGH